VVQVDDLIESRPKQILLAAVPPFPWSHRILRSRTSGTGNQSFDSPESRISILQGNRPKHPGTRQNPAPQFAKMSPPITAFCGFSQSTSDAVLSGRRREAALPATASTHQGLNISAGNTGT
jgi:hypothetical protein